MSRRKLAILGCIGALMVTAFMPAKVTAQEVKTYETEESTVVSPRKTQYVWYYKIENGKKYRRLWDATHDKWVTDWILCP